jgi:tetratricopeptide (TPR) repeat protein
VILLNPKFANAYYNRGIAHGEQREFGLAIADSTKALQIDPQRAETYSNRGTVYADQKNYGLASPMTLRKPTKNFPTYIGRLIMW